MRFAIVKGCALLIEPVDARSAVARAGFALACGALGRWGFPHVGGAHRRVPCALFRHITLPCSAAAEHPCRSKFAAGLAAEAAILEPHRRARLAGVQRAGVAIAASVRVHSSKPAVAVFAEIHPAVPARWDSRKLGRRVARAFKAEAGPPGRSIIRGEETVEYYRVMAAALEPKRRIMIADESY